MLELAGAFEIGQYLGLSRQRVHQLTESPSFPTPVAVLAAGSIWDMNEIKNWKVRMRPTQEATIFSVPARDPARPQDDPWDADAVAFLRSTAEGAAWSRGTLFECLREQSNQRKKDAERYRRAIRLADLHGVERRADVGGTTVHFFRTDKLNPWHYPSSAAERRDWLKAAAST